MAIKILKPCRIVGVLESGIQSLTPEALAYIKSADLIIGSTRTLALYTDIITGIENRDFTFLLTQVPDWIHDAQRQHKQVVVLATGDPLCYGVANFLREKLSPGEFVVHPNISSIQLAFARFTVSWQDAKIISIHHQDAEEWHFGADRRHGLYNLLQAICQHDKLAVLTSPDNTPDRIARMLLLEKLGDQFHMLIAENLANANERLMEDLSIAQIATEKFNGNNVVILLRKTTARAPQLFGLAGHHYLHCQSEKDLINYSEVRAVLLAKMQLTRYSIVWDIGTGSGSIGIEAARLCGKGHIYAMDKNAADVTLARQNAECLAVHNYTVQQSINPEKLTTWERPDAVFIDAADGDFVALIEICLQRLRTTGWLVMNFTRKKNLSAAIETLKSCQATWDVTQMQVSRNRPIYDTQQFTAENPVWIVAAQRKTEHAMP